MKKVINQIFKEFWIPLTLSIFWVSYNIYGGSTDSKWDIQKVVNVFGPTFFLLSWLTGQFFRVKKQTKVESSFEAMEARFGELLDRVEKGTNEMIAHISGGDSFPWILYGMPERSSDTGMLMAFHQGEHPLYDVAVRIVDLRKLKQILGNPSLASLAYADTNIKIGNMIPSHVQTIQPWTLENAPEHSYNIFISARNGNFTQFLRLKKINNSWTSATKIMNTNGKILHEDIDENYPRDPEGNVIWEGHE